MTQPDPSWVASSWQRLWRGLGAAGGGETVRDDVLARYAEPQRHYHTVQHLAECLAAFEPAARLAVRPAEVEAALWFHDAIYDPHRNDNEERSAALARGALDAAGVGGEAVARVAASILRTRHHADPENDDQRLLLDVDLSILGADEPRFDEYERQIRREYEFVSEASFHARRANLLRAFLLRPHIYHLAHFRERLEQRARANLLRSIGHA
jgi:predicted metal-dependent HD superfamily phosphohydrolase